MALTADRYGYLYTDLRFNGVRVRVFAHVLVTTVWHGPKQHPELGALHRNGCSQDNRPENLYWGTPAQNFRDALRHGIYARDGSGRLCSV